VPDGASVVLVHDAARPLASVALFERVIAAVHDGADVAIPVVAVTDTIRHVDGGVVDRDDLRAVQTPQGFAAPTLRAVHVHEPDATDDAGLVEAAGGTVALVDGESTNLKLTDPLDLVVAEALLAAAGPAHLTRPDLTPSAPSAPPAGGVGSPEGELSARLP
ncbi:MAG: 2-C-methyl-D-erythritol 4-phosphate cytidylyltransferase, partial [Actinomycetota bacterium]|nr:2-C-methyl-D-erythritol 4-phosphate cytidylyltransferase [Actinomycetota bacterium]